MSVAVANGKPSNTPKQLMAAFSCEGRPVTVTEFRQFWESLSPEEKDYYKGADLG